MEITFTCLFVLMIQLASAQDSFLVSERLVESLTKYDADILDRMVLVDLQIAQRLQFEVEAAVVREQLQHVIKEADAG